ncbi:unnamed protein product, partial [marine sediment metagenome]
RKFRQTQIAAGAAALLLALLFAGSAEATTFTLYCAGSVNVEGLDPDSFEIGPLQRDISQADRRFWTPEYHRVGDEDVFITENEWNNNNLGYTWWQAQVAQVQAKSKSKAGFNTSGVAVYDPRVQWVNPDHVATGHALACAASGDLIAIPQPGPHGRLGVQGGILGVEGSQWTSVAQPTEKELPPLPIGTPFQFDVLVTSEVRFPENIPCVTVEII